MTSSFDALNTTRIAWISIILHLINEIFVKILTVSKCEEMKNNLLNLQATQQFGNNVSFTYAVDIYLNVGRMNAACLKTFNQQNFQQLTQASKKSIASSFR